MRAILATAALAAALGAASAQTMPNSNQTPEPSGAVMPNANQTSESSNNLPSASGTVGSGTAANPDGTVNGASKPTTPAPPNCIAAASPSCPAPCPPGPTPQTTPTPGTPPCPLPSSTP